MFNVAELLTISGILEDVRRVLFAKHDEKKRLEFCIDDGETVIHMEMSYNQYKHLLNILHKIRQHLEGCEVKEADA